MAVLQNNGQTTDQAVFTRTTKVTVENISDTTEELEAELQSTEFECLLIKPRQPEEYRILLGRKTALHIPPGTAIVFPDITSEEIQARYAHYRGLGFTVEPFNADIDTPVIRAGAGSHNVLLVTRFQPEETTGTFMVDGMLEAFADSGAPDDYTFTFIIEPSPQLIADGPGGRVLDFAPDGDDPSEQRLRGIVDTLKPDLYINLHDWTTQPQDGFYTVDDNLWIPFFLKRAAVQKGYLGKWAITQKQNIPRVSPYPKKYSIGEEMARYNFLQHGAMSVYAEFPWDGRTAEDLAALGPVFIADMLAVFRAFHKSLGGIRDILKAWHAGADEASVYKIIGDAVHALEQEESSEVRKAVTRVISLVQSRYTAYQALKAEKSFPVQDGAAFPEKTVAGIYDPSARFGQAIGVPLLEHIAFNAGILCQRINNLLSENLHAVDLLIIPSVQALGTQDGPDLYAGLVDFCTRQGKRIIFIHDSCGQAHSLCGYSLFPAVCKGALFYEDYEDENRELIIADPDWLETASSRQSYLWKKHLIAGPEGNIVLSDGDGQPLVITGRQGKGSVVFCGLYFPDNPDGSEAFPDGDGILEQAIIRKAVTWQ
ncbi:hypothetical protein ACFL4W_00110 [Planctomycetota bacterium]